MKSITSFSLDTNLLTDFNSRVPKNQRTKTIEKLMFSFLKKDASRARYSTSVKKSTPLSQGEILNEK